MSIKNHKTVTTKITKSNHEDHEEKQIELGRRPSHFGLWNADLGFKDTAKRFRPRLNSSAIVKDALPY